MFITMEEFNLLTSPQVTQVNRTIYTYNGFFNYANAKQNSDDALVIGTATHEIINFIEESLHTSRISNPDADHHSTLLKLHTGSIKTYLPAIVREERLRPTIVHCISSFVDWRFKHLDWDVTYSESAIKHEIQSSYNINEIPHKFQYRGIIDAIYTKPDNTKVLVDYKTSAKISDEYLLQLMAYYIALPNDVKQTTKEVGILRLDKKRAIVDFITTTIDKPIALYSEKLFTRALEAMYLKQMIKDEMISFKIGD